MSGASRRGRGPVVVIVVACLAVYTIHAVVRYLTFHAPAYDLGFFDQVASNLSAGRGWSSSFLGYDFRGQHWEPVLLVWAQLYRLAPTPIWLLVIDSVALAVAPWAAWRLARCWLGAGHPGAVVAALATALSPLVLRAAGFDYHSEALTPVLALLALEAACRRRWLAVVACCAVLMVLKEDGFLVVAGIGWIIFVVERRRGALLLSAAAIAGFVAVVGFYMPGVRHERGTDLLARYGYLAAPGRPSGPFAIAAGMIAHPGTWIGHLGGSTALAGIAVALLPLALLPLFSGWSLLAPLPPLLLALLSSDHYQSALQLQYGIQAFPLLLACALLGWRRVEAWGAPRVVRPGQRRLLTGAAIAVLVAAPALGVRLADRVNDLHGLGRYGPVSALLDEVPATAAVAASTGLVPHLSERPAISEFPDPSQPPWVVIDTAGVVSDEARDAGYASALAALATTYHVVAQSDGVILWQRG